jgi:hypothetical protein
MAQGTTSGISQSRYCSIAQALWSCACESCTIVKEEAVNYWIQGYPGIVWNKYASPAQKQLIGRINIRVIDLFSTICALEGVFVVPALVGLILYRGWPLFKLGTEVLFYNSDQKPLGDKWNEVKEEYRKIVVEEFAPALAIAFAIDLIFCSVVGICTLSLCHLLRAAAVSLPAAYSLYRLLVDKEVKHE